MTSHQGQEEQQMTGAEMIAAERQRQIDEEGWTPEHDAEHDDHELRRAAAYYALPDDWRQDDCLAELWPSEWWFKPKGDIRDLVKAGALIAAEIDRLR